MQIPQDFKKRELPVHLDGGRWYRIHKSKYDALYFGKTGNNRYDDPQGVYGVLYVADDLHGSFVEVFGRQPEIRTVAESELRERVLSHVESERLLKLVDLTGAGLQRAGLTGNVSTDDPYDDVQRLSRKVHEHPGGYDGIRYHLRHDLEQVGVAIFERVFEEECLSSTSTGGLLDPDNIHQISTVIEYYKKDVV